MPRLYLMSWSLVGILFAAPQVSAQEESHVLTQESAVDVQPVQAPPAVAQPRGGGGAGNPGRQGDARGAGRDPAVRAGVRDRDDRRRVVVAPRVVSNGYPYRYAGAYLPSRRGVYGSGYLYYGPRFYYGPGFGYFGPSFGVYYGSYYGYYGGYFGWPGYYAAPVAYGHAYDIGELRLQVSPRTAQVFVDGGYAGTVDDYDGTFQSLKLESGSYSIRLQAPGYQTIDFDVRITPTQKITYREDLRPE